MYHNTIFVKYNILTCKQVKCKYNFAPAIFSFVFVFSCTVNNHSIEQVSHIDMSRFNNKQNLNRRQHTNKLQSQIRKNVRKKIF